MKGDSFNSDASEIDTLRIGLTHQETQAPKLFKCTPDNIIKEEVLKILKIDKQAIKDLILEYGPTEDQEKEILFDTLMERRKSLAERHYSVDFLLSNNELELVYNLVRQDNEISSTHLYSPLNKNEETKLFEQIIHDILNSNNIECKTEDNKVILYRNKEPIELQELIKKVNFSHLSISEEDIEKYGNLYNSLEYGQEILTKENFKHYKNQYEAKYKEYGYLDNLSYGEMLAIRKYSSYDHIDMNQLLRGHTSTNIDNILPLCLDIAIASHGLNKMPDINIPVVIRNEVFDSDRLSQYYDSVQHCMVTKESSFISTGVNLDAVDNFDKSEIDGIKIIYKNVRGKDISIFSKCPKEQEYLISPSTQIKWVGYRHTNGHGHVFTVEGKSILMDGVSHEINLSPSNSIANAVEARQKLKKLMARHRYSSIDYDQVFELLQRLYSKNNIKEFLTLAQNKHLISIDAILLYTYTKITPFDLQSVSPERIKFLRWNISLYNKNYITIGELQELTDGQINFITRSDIANAGERRQQYNWVELQDDPALKNYEDLCTHYRSKVSDLINLSSNQLLVLESEIARGLYDNTNIALSDLIALNIDQLKCIKSMLHIREYVSFSELKGLTIQQINFIASSHAIKLYQMKHITPLELKDLNQKQIKLIDSNSAKERNVADKVAITDLQIDNLTKFSALTASQILTCYQNFRITPQDLEGLELRQIVALISGDAQKCYLRSWIKPQDLKGYEVKKIRALISYTARECYETGKVTVDDLKGLTEEKFNLLTSDRALDCYKTGHVTIADLKDLTKKDFSCLTLYQPQKCYKTGKVTVADLKGLTEEQFNFLTSDRALNCYKTSNVTIADLKDLTEEQFNLLTSGRALNCYKTGHVTVADLKDLTEEKFNLLTSDRALDCYKTGHVTIADLKDLTEEQFNLLTSDRALNCYKTSNVTIADLKDLTEKKFNLLTSYKALDCYKTGHVTVADLKDFNRKQINILFKLPSTDDKNKFIEAQKILQQSRGTHASGTIGLFSRVQRFFSKRGKS